MVIVFRLAWETLMEDLFISTGVVALAEIGDKTQLLAFILAARFKKPIPIVTGTLPRQCSVAVNVPRTHACF